MLDPLHFRQQIEPLLERIAISPTELALHQQLRDAALQYRASGGHDLGILERLKWPLDPLRHLLHVLRLWSFDPGNSDHVVNVLETLHNYAQTIPDANIEPLQQWLVKILMRMESDHPIS